ncbi:hypothetical protein [Chitinasiproducens palmae]|uniref:hypothetical protein n=1 Tax=Chitinasiproducens palmae TaxID=1770053 RepID=UPI001113B5CA|nr:hypothetical protein [Chitinasiproducens palmae]
MASLIRYVFNVNFSKNYSTPVFCQYGLQHRRRKVLSFFDCRFWQLAKKQRIAIIFDRTAFSAGKKDFEAGTIDNPHPKGSHRWALYRAGVDAALTEEMRIW